VLAGIFRPDTGDVTVRLTPQCHRRPCELDTPPNTVNTIENEKAKMGGG